MEDYFVGSENAPAGAAATNAAGAAAGDETMAEISVCIKLP
jgi:THO complex subunit 4